VAYLKEEDMNQASPVSPELRYRIIPEGSQGRGDTKTDKGLSRFARRCGSGSSFDRVAIIYFINKIFLTCSIQAVFLQERPIVCEYIRV
jgi:hypothetical protein